MATKAADGNWWTGERIQDVGWALMIALLIPAALVALLPASANGADCGTWMSPRFDETEVLITQSQILREGGSVFDQAAVRATANECQSTLDTRRVVTLVLLGVAVAVRLGTWRLAPARSKRGEVREFFGSITLVAWGLFAVAAVAVSLLVIVLAT